MKRVFSSLFLLALLAVGCSRGTPAPPTAPPPVPSSTTQSLPTRAEPSQTPEPTPTHLPSLNPTGPWLVGFGRAGVIAMNPDGTGRTVVFADPPDENGDDWKALWWDSQTSPSGWIAQRTAPGDGSFPSPRLLLARLPSNQIVRDLPILSDDLAASMLEEDENGRRNVFIQDSFLAIHLDMGWKGLDWSPDGQMLAFVAAADGPSADLYVYDTQTDEVRRLTDGPNQPYLLGWSPDSRWVLHLEISDLVLAEGLSYRVHGLWAAAADGSGAKQLTTDPSPASIAQWLSPSTVVIYSQAGSGVVTFTRIDLAHGRQTSLRPGMLDTWAVEPKTQTLAFVIAREASLVQSPLASGLYVTTFDRDSPRLVGFSAPMDDVASGLVGKISWSAELGRFLVETNDGNSYAISVDGRSVVPFEGECGIPIPSPDGQWLAFGSCYPQVGIRMGRVQDASVPQRTTEDFRAPFWSPDSSGLYYFEGESPARLMVLPVPDGDPRLVSADPGFDLDEILPSWVGIP
jgi:hypothetical protein